MSTRSAARALATARRDAGLSQEALAARCGVSERTIRTLESGNARRPHRDTLAAVARALGMTGDEVDTFVGRWRDPHRTITELLGARDPSAAIQTELARQVDCVRDRSIDFVVRLGTDRRRRTLTIRRRFEVVAGEVDRYTVVAGFDNTTMDPQRFRMTDWVNIEPGLVVDLPQTGAKAFVGMLRHTLRPGDTYAFEHTADYGRAYRSDAAVDAAVDAADNDLRMAVHKPLDRLLFEVRFADGATPRRVRTLRQDTIDGDAYGESDVPVSPFGISQVYVEPVPSGVHGVRWDWT